MCGIAGIAEQNEALMRRAGEYMRHRGPDAFGVFSDSQVTLGHNRLAIIDLNLRANQPMVAGTGNEIVVYNGEIYNYKQVRAELEQEGYQFVTESDTEVLLCAYEQWGKELTEHISGMFAFGLYDKTAQKIVLVTDHANIKPLFYAHVGNTFVFASELRTVAKILKEKHLPLTVDSDSVSLYFALGYVPAPRTLYTTIRRLPKRAWVEYSLAERTVRESVYSARKAQKLSEPELQALIEQKILAHLVADVPVGVFFSGGTDSSLILSILHKHRIALETFSVRVEGRPGDDTYFNETASVLKVKAHTYTFGLKEFEEVYPEVMRKVDEPLYDNSLFPTYFVSKHASQRVKVVLSGEGGDEYFFGYPRSLALAGLEYTPLDKKISFWEELFLLMPHFRGKNKLFEKLFLIFKQPVAYYLLTMSPAKSLLSRKAWQLAKAAIASAHRVRSFDAELYLPNNLLRKLDMATMYCSIEGRVPLLDPDVIAAAQHVPPPQQGEEKPLLRRMLGMYLPAHLVHRKKQGFGLSLPTLLSTSALLKKDLADAYTYLQTSSITPIQLPTPDILAKRYPHFSFALLSLYHSLKNVDSL